MMTNSKGLAKYGLALKGERRVLTISVATLCGKTVAILAVL
jgi:hypothetical protein